jgi:hypothetical protein
VNHQAPSKKHQDTPREVEGKERPYDAARNATEPLPPPHVEWHYGVIKGNAATQNAREDQEYRPQS